MRQFLLLTMLAISSTIAHAQGGYAFGIKGGLTIGSQRWDESFQRDPLFRYHAAKIPIGGFIWNDAIVE